ncbi:hypothetical protein E2562_037321 [Oryza meyeriana var. granulata]|uniref:Sulfotransferase n=1 Tax=Oryza meyeriana var. granulata TaxID=110450 RepID=A0A6G1CX89_9ORYZ|nr:hypothetical protein E2562_037321 [Oryza meyeriana var. granulata]
MVDAIVELCSLDNMRGLEANKMGYVDSRLNLRRETLFRKGVAGDWVDHMTPEMARRLDDIVAEKLGATGLTFLCDLEPAFKKKHTPVKLLLNVLRRWHITVCLTLW